MTIEIDPGSGFCFGVTTAISKAESVLASGARLYCLGDIVHNGQECERLRRLGLVTIDHTEFATLRSQRVLLRAHGEPPSTYAVARDNDISLVDATCPVVLALQRRIRREYLESPDMQILIFGKRGHAEVLGLVGQTEGTAIVVESFDDLASAGIDFTRDTSLYSQTTKSIDEYRRVIVYCESHMAAGVTFRSYDTICRQVSGRMEAVAQFASRHDVVIFVSGVKSSNGRVLFNECLKVNANAHHVEKAAEIEPQWLRGASTVGICGATSTPKWLMEECRERVLRINN